MLEAVCSRLKAGVLLQGERTKEALVEFKHALALVEEDSSAAGLAAQAEALIGLGCVLHVVRG